MPSFFIFNERRGRACATKAWECDCCVCLSLLRRRFNFFRLSLQNIHIVLIGSHAVHRHPGRPWPTNCVDFYVCETKRSNSYLIFLLRGRFSCQKAFRDVLAEVNDQAGQHEVVAENLTSAVSKEIVALVKDLKEERKKVLHVYYHLDNKFEQLGFTKNGNNRIGSHQN